MFNATVKLALGAAALFVAAGHFASTKTIGPLSAPTLSSANQPVRTVSYEPPRGAIASGYGKMELAPDSRGHYHASVELEGRNLKMLVDTGASVIALTDQDAGFLGIRPMPSDYTITMQTANGNSKAARVRLREVRIGSIRVNDVDAIIMQPGASAESLLGMSFLRKLAGFEIAQGKLIMRQ